MSNLYTSTVWSKSPLKKTASKTEPKTKKRAQRADLLFSTTVSPTFFEKFAKPACCMANDENPPTKLGLAPRLGVERRLLTMRDSRVFGRQNRGRRVRRPAKPAAEPFETPEATGKLVKKSLEALKETCNSYRGPVFFFDHPSGCC